MRQDASVTILGARGSIPVSGEEFLRFGGATTCILIRLAGQAVVLDAGTGLLALPEFLKDEESRISLLLSHPHADHLLGLPLCPLLSRPGFRFDIYAARRGGFGVEEQVRSLMSPPLWPIGPERLPAPPVFYDLPPRLELGSITVDCMEGIHPGGVSLFRLTGGGRRVVFATDCTLTDDLIPTLTEFARDCDLLLCDGQYSDAEWPSRAGFGHSTWTAAARLGRDCGAKQIRVIHHDPSHTDSLLNAAEEELRQIHPNCAFAHVKEEVLL
ncbi:MAG: MBL fold metallo-hydrolase [Clostridiales bacterium]|nr:MBL fold metallo-hydrolase [Clostridiales bacterium]